MSELSNSLRFRQNLYRWAKHEWEAELASGCRRLLSLPSSRLRRFATRLRDRPGDEQSAIVAAVLKRAHEQAAVSLGDRLSPRERSLLDSLRPRPAVASWERPPAIDRRALRKAVVSALQPIAGPLDESFGRSAEWRHVRAVPPAVLVTHVDTGGFTRRQVEFTHDVRNSGGEDVMRFISLSSWLGIATGLLFDCIEPGEEVAAAEAAAGVVAHFAAALPGLCA